MRCTVPSKKALASWLASAVLAVAADAGAAPQAESLDRFRNLFYTYLAEDGLGDRAELDRLVFMPPVELLSPPPSAGDPFAELEQRYAGYHPTDLYRAGVAHAATRVADADESFARTGPVTIVLVPGIFGEFIDNRPYEEVLRAGGSFRDRWEPALAAASDTVYSLDALAEVERPLSELVNVASIDGPDGQPLVNYVLLRPLRGSLETLGTLDGNVQVYLRRLSKVFSIIGEPDTRHLFLMGYSRGASVALDLVVKARRRAAAHPWATRIRGVVGLVGTFYGTELADSVVYASDSPTHRAFQVLEGLANSLRGEPGSNWMLDQANRAYNTYVWADALQRFAGIAQEAARAGAPGLGHERARLTAAQPDRLSLASLFYHVAFVMLGLDRPVSDYYGNVQRFQLLLRRSIQGIESLTTYAAREWWQTHVVPGDVAIYSLTGTLPDVTPEADALSELTEFPGYGVDTVDYQKSLRSSFYDLQALTGTELNDSQVTMYGSRYWPELARWLNPAQQPLEHHYLAALGTHHWGCSFPVAFQATSGAINQYPRAVLLKAIGAYLASTL
jgi:hypothetical protein